MRVPRCCPRPCESAGKSRQCEVGKTKGRLPPAEPPSFPGSGRHAKVEFQPPSRPPHTSTVGRKRSGRHLLPGRFGRAKATFSCFFGWKSSSKVAAVISSGLDASSCRARHQDHAPPFGSDWWTYPLLDQKASFRACDLDDVGPRRRVEHPLLDFRATRTSVDERYRRLPLPFEIVIVPVEGEPWLVPRYRSCQQIGRDRCRSCQLNRLVGHVDRLSTLVYCGALERNLTSCTRLSVPRANSRKASRA